MPRLRGARWLVSGVHRHRAAHARRDGRRPGGQCGTALALCHNCAVEAVCNRCVPQELAGGLSDCRCHNEVIPDLSVAGHGERWAALEAAKRRVFCTPDLAAAVPAAALEKLRCVDRLLRAARI